MTYLTAAAMFVGLNTCEILQHEKCKKSHQGSGLSQTIAYQQLSCHLTYFAQTQFLLLASLLVPYMTQNVIVNLSFRL